MKGILYLILALVLVFLVWGLIKAVIFTALALVIKIGMILLFCALVYWVFTALTKKDKAIL